MVEHPQNENRQRRRVQGPDSRRPGGLPGQSSSEDGQWADVHRGAVAHCFDFWLS